MMNGNIENTSYSDLASQKHENNALTTQNSPTDKEFYTCIFCNYTCSKKQSYERHITSQKHLMNDSSQTTNTMKIYDCKLCNKVYKDRAGLWRHKQKCDVVLKKKEEKKDTIYDLDKVNNLDSLSMDNANLTKLFLESVRENRDFQKQMFELMRDNMGNMGNTTNNNINNSQNTMNNHFNLNFFLNETCKDAMDIDDFIDYVKVQIDDFENFGRVGYPKAVGDIIVRNLNQLDVRHRPIHCSDLKREVLHVKHDGVWHSDDTQRFIKKSIMYVANKNIKQIPKWQDLNPESRDCFTKSFDKYNKLCRASLGAATDEEEADFLKKITSIVAKEVVIDKKKKY